MSKFIQWCLAIAFLWLIGLLCQHLWQRSRPDPNTVLPHDGIRAPGLILPPHRIAPSAPTTIEPAAPRSP